MKGSMLTDQIKVVIFDQGGVLSRGGGKGTNEIAAAQVMGLSSIAVPDLIEALKRGQIDNDQFIDGVNQYYPNAPTRLTDEMWDIVYASLKKESLSYEFAYRCLELGKRIGLLSNINPAIAERLLADGSYNGFDLLCCLVMLAMLSLTQRSTLLSKLVFLAFRPRAFFCLTIKINVLTERRRVVGKLLR
jgi:hypothetical protein